VQAVIVSAFPRGVRLIEHTPIPLGDGTELAARIWLPADAERHPVPAILEYLPYRKRDGTNERDALTHPWLAGHGYAGVRVDIRGTGESGGLISDEYTKQEHVDALEVIAWLARQPWCSGAVGMMGISWGGFNALQVAALRPPALKAIVSLCSTDDRYRDDVHRMGGALLADGLGWASFFFRTVCRPPDPALVGERWRAMWRERLENVPLFMETWLGHQRRDAYWKHGSICEDYGAVRCPTLLVGGWTDGYTNTIPRMLERLSCPRKGLIGPWAHAYPHFARPGPQIGFLQEMLRWWDHWLKGIDTGVMDEPMLTAWMTDSVTPADHHEALPGRWIEEPCWPPPDRTTHRLFLTDDGLATKETPLRPRPVSTPQTVGRHAGEWCSFGGNDQADDQNEDDARSLTFETAPIDRTLELLGAPVLDVELASDKPVAHLVARLCDVHPSGESLRVSYGILNLAHRDSDEEPTPLVPGRRYRVRLQLNDAGSVFPAGHKIRLALSTTYWPLLWPSPEAATLTIHAGKLELPLRPPRGAETERRFANPETAPPDKVTAVAPGVKRIDRLGLELGTHGQSSWHIDDDDPTSAVAELRHTDTMARGDWRIRTETSLRLSCTRDDFLLQASLRACEGDKEICARSWNRRIPRDCL
jgi:putative CocE/NonD family hydrolase